MRVGYPYSHRNIVGRRGYASASGPLTGATLTWDRALD